MWTFCGPFWLAALIMRILQRRGGNISVDLKCLAKTVTMCMWLYLITKKFTLQIHYRYISYYNHYNPKNTPNSLWKKAQCRKQNGKGRLVIDLGKTKYFVGLHPLLVYDSTMYTRGEEKGDFPPHTQYLTCRMYSKLVPGSLT